VLAVTTINFVVKKQIIKKLFICANRLLSTKTLNYAIASNLQQPQRRSITAAAHCIAKFYTITTVTAKAALISLLAQN